MTAPINKAAERLRGMVKAGRGWPTDYLDLLDAALATERRNTVERIRTRLEAAAPPEPPRPAHAHKVNAGCFPSCPAHYSRVAAPEGLPLDVERLLVEIREFLGRSLDDIGVNRWTLVEKIDARLSPSSGESE